MELICRTAEPPPSHVTPHPISASGGLAGSLSETRLLKLVASVRGENNTVAQRELVTWCYRFVTRWHRSGQSTADCEEIVQTAFMETLDKAARIPHLSDREYLNILKRALEKLKKRRQRELSNPIRFLAVETSDHLTPGRYRPTSAEESAIATARARRVLLILFDLLRIEIPALKKRDRALVVTHYKLNDFFPPVEKISFNTPAAARKATYRARKRLSEALIRRLDEQLRAQPEQRQGFEDALAIVRGEDYREPLEMLLELSGFSDS